MGKGKREQTRNAESVANTRQDRNTFVTDGGTWSWDAGTGTLAWSGDINIRRGGVVLHRVEGPSSVVGLSSAGSVAFVDVDRSDGGFIFVQGGSSPGPLTNLNSSSNSTDERLVLGVRGADDKFYLRDGTVFSDGDSKTLGTLNAATDRGDILASGAATDTVPFSYAVGSDQLAVYVGGMLQVVGVHYSETNPTTITWTALGQPRAGEMVTFYNVVGGQGPAGSGGPLQTAYDNGRTIVAGGAAVPLYVWSSLPPTGGEWPSLLAWGDSSSAPRGYADANGNLQVTGGTAGVGVRDNSGSGTWRLVPLDDGGSDLLLYNTKLGRGVRFDSAGGVEHGEYTPGIDGYPGGGWTPYGTGGGLAWAVFTGTIDGAGAEEVIKTDLPNIKGALLSVFDGSRGGYSSVDLANTQFTGKRISAFFDDVTGDVTLSGNLAGSAPIGSDLWGEPYTLIVFYQG